MQDLCRGGARLADPGTCPDHLANKKGSQGLTFCLLGSRAELIHQPQLPPLYNKDSPLQNVTPCLPCVTVDFSRYVQRGFLDWMQVKEAEFDFKKSLWGVPQDS